MRPSQDPPTASVVLFLSFSTLMTAVLAVLMLAACSTPQDPANAGTRAESDREFLQLVELAGNL
jgi:hypothetical protein